MSLLVDVLLLIVWVAIALIPARIAESKGRGFWPYFFLSIFFWWITLFVVIFMKDNSHPVAQQPPTAPQA